MPVFVNNFDGFSKKSDELKAFVEISKGIMSEELGGVLHIRFAPLDIQKDNQFGMRFQSTKVKEREKQSRRLVKPVWRGFILYIHRTKLNREI
jgi:hypothetical protein